MEVNPAWDLDALYLRAPDEKLYARNLRSLWHISTAMPNLMSMDLLCFYGSLILFGWPIPQTPCPADYRNFSPSGDLPNPDGGEVSLDIAWALRQGSIPDNCGDHRKMIAGIRKEARDLTRKYAQFVRRLNSIIRVPMPCRPYIRQYPVGGLRSGSPSRSTSRCHRY
jgi:hypothetical protein